MAEPDVLGSSETVGNKNGEAARGLLERHGIAIVSESLFGAGHRQIIFNVRTGYVGSRQVGPRAAAKACKQEKA